MKIGIDASRANRVHKSGTEWYSYYLIRWLAKLDEKNEYILYSDKPFTGGLIDLTTDQYENKPQEVRFDERGFQIIKSPFNNFRGKILNWPSSSLWTQGRMSIEMIIHRPDLLFIPAHVLPIIHPRKSLVTIHDIAYAKDCLLYPEEDLGPENYSSRSLINFFVRMLSLGKYRANTMDYLKWSTKYALKHAKKIITVSVHTKMDLAEIYRAKLSKIEVVHNGYNQALYKVINDKEKIKNVLNKYGIESPYLFYIGRLERKKNIPALIESFAIMRQNNNDIKHKLVLAGDASYGYDEAKYMVHEYDLANEVIMTGWLDEKDIPYIYNGATAFVFPSRYEGFGIPLLQSMACGTPIIASNVSSIPEVVGDAAILIDPTDLGAISAAMEQLILDDNLKKELIAKGMERIKNFSWQKTAVETLALINKMN